MCEANRFLSTLADLENISNVFFLTVFSFTGVDVIVSALVTLPCRLTITAVVVSSCSDCLESIRSCFTASLVLRLSWIGNVDFCFLGVGVAVGCFFMIAVSAG